jgi:hypothetical protein
MGLFLTAIHFCPNVKSANKSVRREHYTSKTPATRRFLRKAQKGAQVNADFQDYANIISR